MRRLFTLAALTLGVATAQAAQPGVLTIRFLDVGQGDAVLITSPEGKSLLYDGGRSEARMRELLSQYKVRSLDLVAASHGDADHITGLVPAVQLFKPKFFLNNGIAPTTQIWQKLVGAVSKAGAQGLLAKAQVINLGSVKITVIPPPPGGPKDEQNVNSIGLLVQYGTFRALMTGDSETPETNAWLKSLPMNLLGPTDVYKSIHHGAKNGDSARWLAAVRPKNVVVGVGPNNYGHPTSEALSLYKKAGAGIFRTDLNGTVTVTVQKTGQYAITTEKGTGVAGRSKPVTVPATPAPYYRSCAAANSAGAAPLRVGQPGYGRHLDRDGDGVACE
ncbi:excalibur calcium-binding domain-containing protein [Deinococcus navajonensis]|uniref:Excalibur calcium-binding domain-containing protein n=1 Tax=Deinococcus navajonensis TaxID=309884 RepID=A0ABV8XQN1_9DEIO